MVLCTQEELNDKFSATPSDPECTTITATATIRYLGVDTYINVNVEANA